MKSTAFFVLLMFSQLIYGQSAEEIWHLVQVRYQTIANYIDDGEYSIEGHPVTVYSLAIDSNQNVYYKLQHKGVDPRLSYKFTYKKSADEDEGIFIRETTTGIDTSSWALPDRCYADAGSLREIAKLMFPVFFAREITAERAAELRGYPSVRQTDTLINLESFYVIDRYSTHMWPSEYTDEKMTNKDASLASNQSKEIPIGADRFYIRQHDLIVYQMEEFSYREDGQILSRQTFTMNPRIDVDDFEKYLRK